LATGYQIALIIEFIFLNSFYQNLLISIFMLKTQIFNHFQQKP